MLVNLANSHHGCIIRTELSEPWLVNVVVLVLATVLLWLLNFPVIHEFKYVALSHIINNLM